MKNYELLAGKFVEIAKRYPNKVAFVDGVRGQEFTYGRALIAVLLLKKKFKGFEQKKIGMMVPTSGGAIIALIAALAAGKTSVMINYSTGIIKNCQYAKEKCGVELVLTSKKLLEKLNVEPTKHMVFLEDIFVSLSSLDKAVAFAKSKLPVFCLKASFNKLKLEDTCVMLFTSGSEKEPKCVPISQKNVLSQLNSYPHYIPMMMEDVVMANLPLFHVFGYTVLLWYGVYYGATLVTHPNPLEFKTLCEIFEKYKVTFTMGTPNMFSSYLRYANERTFAHIRTMIAGADKLGNKTKNEYRERFGVELFEGYGVTEASPVISTNIPGHDKPGSVGRALPGVEVKIVDDRTRETLPNGKEGKILVRGENVISGYYNDVEESSLRFCGGWYDTGDMGILDNDGYLWHRGRLRRFVKVGGEMVSLAAIEESLGKIFPEGLQYCMVGLPDDKKGARLILVTNGKVSRSEVITQLTEDGFSKIYFPKKFQVAEELPIMGNGKINFRAVEQMALDAES